MFMGFAGYGIGGKSRYDHGTYIYYVFDMIMNIYMYINVMCGTDYFCTFSTFCTFTTFIFSIYLWLLGYFRYFFTILTNLTNLDKCIFIVES